MRVNARIFWKLLILEFSARNEVQGVKVCCDHADHYFRESQAANEDALISAAHVGSHCKEGHIFFLRIANYLNYYLFESLSLFYFMK